VKLLERGAYAEVLRYDSPYLVDLLCPQSDYPGLSDRERAKEAEKVIKEAIEEIASIYDTDYKEALWRLFAFREGLGLRGKAPRSRESQKMKRRRSACEVLGDIKPETFRGDYQRPYLEALAGILYDKYIVRTEQG